MPSTSSSIHSTSSMYTKSGIGGAGNIRLSSSTAPSLPCPSTSVYKSSNSTFSTGIGGAGNSHSVSSIAKLTASERKSREKLHRNAAPTAWHTGIGGLGNCATRDSSRSSANSNANKLNARLLAVFAADEGYVSADERSVSIASLV